jgi:hypothetical protein
MFPVFPIIYIFIHSHVQEAAIPVPCRLFNCCRYFDLPVEYGRMAIKQWRYMLLDLC